MSAWAKPGVKCVYTGGSGIKKVGWLYPLAGQIVTIREIRTLYNGTVIVLLHEVRNPKNLWGREPGYNVAYFRPLVSQADDLALFTHLLDGQPIRETV